MLSFKAFLSESFNDKHVYKAIFVLGLPGAGKTTLSKQLPCRVIDIDTYQEFNAWKKGRNIDDVASKIGDMSDSLGKEASTKFKMDNIQKLKN